MDPRFSRVLRPKGRGEEQSVVERGVMMEGVGEDRAGNGEYFPDGAGGSVGQARTTGGVRDELERIQEGGGSLRSSSPYSFSAE